MPEPNDSRSPDRPPRRRLPAWLFRLIVAALCCVFAVSAWKLISYYAASARAQSSFSRLIEDAESKAAVSSSSASPSASSSSGTGPVDQTAVCRVLTQENPFFACWIRIGGTNISYPVMCTPDEPEYYLRRGFDGNYSYSGTPFFGAGCTLDSDNLIIYGHNMNSHTMFSQLEEYRDRSFWEKNPSVEIDTADGVRLYTIMAAFAASASAGQPAGTFIYYSYTGSLSEQQFADYVQGVRSSAIYDTGITASYGDRLLTLSTCDYNAENGRFVVVAKLTG